MPCVPTELQNEIDCLSNLATVSWASAPGAVNYTAVVTGPQGEQYYCNTANSSCSFTQLSCGLVYEATVVAVGKMCSSDRSPSIAFHTVPCVASDLQWQFQCGADHALLSWSAALGGIKYTTTIRSQDGEKSNCSTTDTQCKVHALQCGQVYTVTVDSFGVVCSSEFISPEMIHTGPCIPQDIAGYVDCQVNSAVVSWSSTAGSVNYTALLSTPEGEEHTCHTTSTSCNLTGLNCSAIYNVSVTALNDRCQTDSSHEFQLVTAPCAPNDVHTEIDCTTNSLAVSWNQVTATESFTSYLIAPHGGNRTCNSAQSNCTFPSLPCGYEFIVTVSATNSWCGGAMSQAVNIWTAPCIPVIVNTALDCITNSALISWSLSQGALSYMSSLMGSQGERYNCRSQGTSCWMRDVPCGESYTVGISAQNDNCISIEHTVAVLETCPCAPQNLSIFYPCDSNVVKLQWMAPPGSVHYESSVISSGGEIHTCNTTDTTCDIGGLECGEIYNVTVTAFNDQQNNISLKEVTFQSAPCIPTNVRAKLHCGTSTGSLRWETAQGITTYSALVTGINGWSGMCTSDNISCDISDLECGQVYTVTITASNPHCNSIGRPTEIYTAPCVPQNVRTVVMCGTNMTEVSWDRTPGAFNYTATVIGANGEVYSCTTAETACNFKAMDCGQTYYVTVAAYGEQCKTESTTVEFHTGPCVPQILSTMPECAVDSITLSWNAVLGADYYIGALTDKNGKTLTCNTTDQSCNIRGTECGEAYTETIAAHNDQCSSKVNSSFLLYTAPCVPTNLTSSVTCETHYLSVSWDDAPGAITYTVAAHSGQDEMSFKTSNTYYEFKDLLCDEDYEVIISSDSATCNSMGNSSLRVKTIPCAPSILAAYTSCENNSGIIQWDISRNARSYMATVEGVHLLSCNTTDTGCEIPKLDCGQNYTVTVWAEDGICISQNSTKMTFRTVPCVVQNVISTVICQENTLHVSWNVSSGATAYLATTVGSQGDVVTADTAEPNCLLSPLQCGEVYSLTVLAMNGECNSSESATVEVISAPCSPMHLTSSPECDINGAIGTWELSAGALSYIAVFHGPDGDVVSCTSPSTSCSVSGLHCGQDYNVTVTASDGSCDSVTTKATIVTTVPCVPTNIEASTDCTALDLIYVTWSASRGAESYVVIATGTDGHTLSCNTTADTCTIQGVHCGTNYSVSVTAWNTGCSSDTVTTVAVETVPCTPDMVEVVIDCLTQEAMVSWQENSIHTSNHTAIASDPSGMEQSCTTLFSSCHITGLECGLEYSFQVYSSNRQCSSLKSVTYKSMTAPCQPQGLSIGIDCSSQTASMFWEESDGAQLYSILIESITGTGSSYTTTNISFSSEVLSCGQTYGFSVMAVGGTCNSSRSLTLYENSAPCTPSNVTYIRNCSTTMAFVTWSASEGAIDYHVTATESGGMQLFCNSTNNTCWLMDLNCGLSYLVEVVAMGQKCSSYSSSSVLLDTAPCLPNNTAVHMDCEANSAIFSWEASRGALGYLALVKKEEDFVYSFDTEETNCTVLGLSCGTSYSFSVLAKDLLCNSSFTAPIVSGLVPCPPNEVETSIYYSSVKHHEIEVSWNGSHCGTDYMATVNGQIGNDPESLFTLNSYWTSYMDFYIPVPCSSSYNVTVTAQNLAGASIPSTPIAGYTAPCSPQVKPLVVNEGSILISWEATPYTEEYRVVEIETSNIICTTPGLSCQIPFTSSSFQVIAVNPSGESTPAFLSGYNSISSP
ncbi:uncharacterized protein LOC134957920 isoform X2 [Pseudophryne corroboree]|uniref:uncharacterized protein LOC134957920 isoform X2 n=1 Tax=Pseudophryne corroboree TaxID=495146 RepID=UPI003081DB60